MAFLIPTIIAQGIYTGIIGTISSVTIGACSTVKSIYTHQNPNINKIIKKLDIERRLKLVQSILKTFDNGVEKRLERIKYNDLEKTQVFEMINFGNNVPDDDPVQVCLFYLQETVQNIYDVLTKLNLKVKNHHNKWFSSWRHLNVKSLLRDLETNSDLLAMRFDDLTKIMAFVNN